MTFEGEAGVVMKPSITLRQPPLNETNDPTVTICGHSKINYEMPHLTVTQILRLTPTTEGMQVISRGEGMSMTEAPDMTVASSLPWCCCGRQWKTSLVETGDTKEEYDMKRTKKEGRGPRRNPCLQIQREGNVCVRLCVDGMIVYLGTGCQRVQTVDQTTQTDTRTDLFNCGDRQRAVQRSSLTHRDGQTDSLMPTVSAVNLTAPLLLLLLWATHPTMATNWLSLARLPRSRPVSGTAPCARLRGLTPGQVGVCRARGEVMESVRKAAEMVIEECQHQFRNRRWNCSTTPRGINVFGRVMNQGTREAAFLHALSSAAVAVAVTRACTRGELERCGCDRKVRGVSPEGFQWSGCSDNLSYGVAFSQTFVDEPERAKGLSAGRPLMNLHNNEAGRKAILHNMQVECKCHGVSGSCELRTCWKVMPPFRRVGVVLKERFDGATEVRLTRIGSRTALLPRDPQVKPPAARDLVYLAPSPDFCHLDPDNGIPGTAGRRCNGTSRLAPDGCELVCCGPGYRAGRAEVVQRCSCKFSWCCSVRCQQCKNTVTIHTCRV
ncbi:hypothetical protein Q8A73_007803 [Channa argus]|nr:hypothetical protein Q8A73_007803 [Channa argus]